MPIKKYIQDKLKILQRDFQLNLSDEEVAHMKSLKTESDVNAYAYDLLREKL